MAGQRGKRNIGASKKVANSFRAAFGRRKEEEEANKADSRKSLGERIAESLKKRRKGRR